jgi:hypothetical protein
MLLYFSPAAAYLISSWALLYLDKSPEEAFRPFRGGSTAPFPPWVSDPYPNTYKQYIYRPI